MIQTISIRDFSGGIATTSQKKDIPFSARFIKSLNPFEDPSYITLAKAASKISSTTITDLCVWMEDGSPYTTNRFAYDLSGNLYQITSSDVVSKIRTVSGATGEGLKIFDDYLYYMLPTDIGRYGKLSGTPAFNDSLLSWWDAAISDIQQTGGGTGNTYSLTNALSEGVTHLQTISAIEHDPIRSVTVNISAKGTGDWTLVVHDSEDTTIGTKTITNASLAASGNQEFLFTTQLRTTIGNDYHIHLYSSDGTGSVVTGTASDFETAQLTVQFSVLIDSEFHPAVVVEDKLIIGNKEYLAVFDGATYDPNKILLDRGFEVRSMDKSNEFVTVACFKGTSVDTAEESRIFYWDSIQTTWNYFTDTTSMGVGNAISNTGNKLRGIFGNQGALCVGDSNEGKVFSKTPKLTRGKKVNVYPSSIAHHNGITLIGIGTTDDAVGVEQGVYAYGAEDNRLQEALVLLYIASTGTTQGTAFKIGFVKVIGEEVFFSWRDGASYGIDKVAVNALAVTTGTYESLIFDHERVIKDKLALNVDATCETLASGETLETKYKLDRTTSFTSGTAATAGSTRAEVGIYQRFKEMEWGFTLTSSNGTFPKVTELINLFNDLSEEKVR